MGGVIRGLQLTTKYDAHKKDGKLHCQEFRALLNDAMDTPAGLDQSQHTDHFVEALKMLLSGKYGASIDTNGDGCISKAKLQSTIDDRQWCGR